MIGPEGRGRPAEHSPAEDTAKPADNAALASLQLDAGPVHVLVQRLERGVAVVRLDESAWRFAADLCGGCPLQAALDAAGVIDACALRAEHLAAGRFIGFTLAARCAEESRCRGAAS